MSQRCIPIIGEMSAGKSNFLNAFLGLDNILETGVTTTTKFVCLIKNNSTTKFYHVIPRRQSGYLVFNKEGNEMTNLEQIRTKIKQINEQLTNSKGNKNDIFYCLETPIKNKLITEKLDNCYFMDIPGLNENEANYFEEIFSLLKLDDIFFEIIIFNSEGAFGGDAIPQIIKKLNNKNCLKKQKNLYILNKIDKCTNPDECIENFKKFFYDYFQDDKKKIEVEINIYENEFVPISSLLYQAEIKYKEDFYYFLMIFLLQYIKELTKEESFTDFLEKKVKTIIAQNIIKKDDIDDEIENLEDNDLEIINKSIEKLKKIIFQLKRDSGFSLGIQDEINDEIKEAYIIFKKKLYKNYVFSKSYKILEDSIKNIISKDNDFPCPPLPQIPIVDNNDPLAEMLNFLKNKLKNKFEENCVELKVIRDNLLGNKLRIAFIGNISVGKSTILNCIIGEDILPTKEEDCTFRVIIIKHRNINDFHLYQTKEIEFGRGGKKYISFVEKEKYYCKGVNKINAFLKTKNSDKNMIKTDRALIIQGRLKIFDFIKLDENLIKKIEFIDLPGLNRKDGGVLDQDFYDEILEYCNSCLYINLPTIKDITNSANIQKNYNRDKKNISIHLRNEFLGSCLFIINRADEIQDEYEKTKIKNDLINILKKVENNVEKNLNICFFSGKFFLIYLEHYNNYVYLLENSPFSLLYILYEEFSDSWFDRSFNKFIIKKCDKIAEILLFKLRKNFEVPNDFANKMKVAFKQLYEALDIKFSTKDQDDMIKKLYNLNYEIKNHDFSKTYFSRVFFDKLKEIIIKIDNLQRKNLKLMIDQFFQGVDDYFNRNLIEERKKAKEKNQKKYDIFKNKLIPKISGILDRKSDNLKKIIENSKIETLKVVDDEITNASSRLKDANNDLGKASENLEKKIKVKIDEMKKNCENEIKTIGDDIKKEADETIDSCFSTNDLSVSNVEIVQLKNAFISLVSGALGGVLSGTGLYMGGAAVAAGIAAGTISMTSLTSFIGSFFGPIGIIGGLALGALIGGLVSYFRKTSKYVESLNETKPKIEESFKENEKNVLKDFEKFKIDLNIELRKKLEIFHKDIEFSEEEWEKIKRDYYTLRDKTLAALKEKFKNIK